MGWAQTNRDHGGLIFIDLRDPSGLAQCVFNPEDAPEAHAEAQGVRSDIVVVIVGWLCPDRRARRTPRLATGEIEVHVTRMEILNVSKTPPFLINDENAPEVDENLRLRYRYLDLRNTRMLRNLRVAPSRVTGGACLS